MVQLVDWKLFWLGRPTESFGSVQWWNRALTLSFISLVLIKFCLMIYFDGFILSSLWFSWNSVHRLHSYAAKIVVFLGFKALIICKDSLSVRMKRLRVHFRGFPLPFVYIILRSSVTCVLVFSLLVVLLTSCIFFLIFLTSLESYN